MNMIQVYTMVIQSISVLSKESRNFDNVVDNTNLFIDWANDEFIKNNLDYTVENCLPEKRNNKKKLMPGENTHDETPENSIFRFKTQVFNVVYDQVVSSLNNRFKSHGDLYKESSLLDPRYFKENLPENSFNWMSSKLPKFNSEITVCKLHSEMQDFIRKWPKLKLIVVSIELL
ncbi:unnamed protein product [Macrosiphum euphorbiae]|uniref:Uncharacterized protein n=1 Tax=Macrosiphum euphorbiae TaxID=13131 RepID=A0AAV0WL68_9HEMI|nr:unnamed protein product [Macrosiphum euphorbiae]